MKEVPYKADYVFWKATAQARLIGRIDLQDGRSRTIRERPFFVESDQRWFGLPGFAVPLMTSASIEQPLGFLQPLEISRARA